MLGTETVGGSVLVSKNPAPEPAAPEQASGRADPEKQKRQGYHYDWNQNTLQEVAGSEGVTVVISIDAGGKLVSPWGLEPWAFAAALPLNGQRSSPYTDSCLPTGRARAHALWATSSSW